jgi:thiol-disulfide isomerase/thioredoxin
MEAWMQSLRTAGTPDQQRELVAAKPDAIAHARRMWRCIGSQLDEGWTLEPAAWLLRMSAVLRGMTSAPAAPDNSTARNEWVEIITAIRTAVTARHVGSTDPGLIPMCLALVDVPDPESLEILGKIESGHPDAKVRGVAALAVSMALKYLGDEGEVMARRLRMLRKAIIESAEVEIEGVTVAAIAEDELYLIRHLSKGRIAPELAGTDVAGRPLKLSDFSGKVVALVFWGAWNEDSQRIIEMMGGLRTKLAGHPFEVVGVNADPAPTLRELVAGGQVPWPNLSDPNRTLAKEYRITTWPAVFVLDRKRVIRYIGAPGSFVDLTVEAILAEGQ